MRTFDATAAKNRFGELLEACAAGPVSIRRHRRVVAYVVAPRDFAGGGAPEPSLNESLAARLRGAGARYATLFGSVARGKAGPGSDIDVAVSFGKPMSSDLRAATIALIADVAARPVDLVDLETATGLILSRALQGSELLCDEAATRQRLIARLLRSEGDRRSAEIAANAARASLFS